jgi:ketosteroid isomerase-like protein
MRYSFIASIMIALPLVSSNAEAARNNDVVELTRLASEAGRAYANRDIPALERITASDYFQTDVRGGVLGRSQWLDFVRKRHSQLTVTTDDVSVRLYGDAAVVAGRWTYVRHEKGSDVTTYSRWTSFWTRDHLQWKRHAFQNTYVNADADRCLEPKKSKFDSERPQHPDLKSAAGVGGKADMATHRLHSGRGACRM